jgi:hypothetical protein
MEEKKKIILCFFGVISRSIRYTHKSIENKLIKILKNKYNVTIFILNNNIELTKVDNILVNNNDKDLLKADILEEIKQKDIDKIIEKIFNQKKCRIKDYGVNALKNSLRQMYCEEQVGIFLEKNINNYDTCIVCGPDYYITNNINLNDVENSINEKNKVYTTNMNDAHGYTNGFYIGNLISISKILKRYSILDQILPVEKDYEWILKKSFEMNNITRLVTDLKFIKIRNNKKVAMQGIKKWSPKKYQKIIEEINNDLQSM